MHLAFARGLAYIVVLPVGGLLAMMWTHLGLAWVVGIDVAAVILLEMALVGGPVALAVGAKSLPAAVVGAFVLPMFLPRPTTTAVIVSGLIVASTVAGFAWYLIRAHGTFHKGTWNRTVASLTCLAVAATGEMSVAGLALTMGRFDPGHLAAALAFAPWWLAAYTLQTSPRRGESRARRLFAVVRWARDQISPPTLAGGVR